MKAASSSEIREALRQQANGRLVDICLRLARFKKENKELLTYILFEADDEAAYVSSVKKEMDTEFAALNKSSVYLAKKTIRKVLRTANRFIRYAGSATVEAELLLHFCHLLKHSGVQLRKSTALQNLYDNQVRKVRQAVKGLHEDLQYDYFRQLDELQ